MGYNMTAFENSTNVFQMFEAVNTASENWLSYLFLIGLFIIMLITLLRNNPPAESFTGASTLATVVSLLFLMGNLINIVWVIGFTILFAGSAVSLYLTNKT